MINLLILTATLSLSDIKNDMLASNCRDTIYLQQMAVKEFKNKLAELESQGYDHTVVNSFGYKGKYQVSDWLIRRFSKNPQTYLQSPHNQEITQNRLILFYISELNRLKLDQYIGKCINNHEITLEGLIAGWHLYPVALVKYLRSDGKIDLKDGMNTPVSKFINYYENS